MHASSISRPLIAALCATALAATLSASGPVTWITATQVDFLKGQAIGVSVDEIGRITAAPAISVLHDAASPQVWSVAAGPGDTWVAGTGADGRVVRSRAGQVATLLDTAEANVYAVATAPDGRVFAASGPDGKVYAIDATGASRVLFDPAEKYIWALAVDRAGRVWVGTGTPAVVYRIETDGTARAIYKPAASHVVSLAVDSAGRLLAGTEGPGRVYRFDANDRPVALLDSGLAEIRAIAASPDGTVFAAALAGDAAAGDATGSSASLGASSASAPVPATQPTRRSVIFKVPAIGLPEPLWETSDVVYDIATGDAGAVLAATGPDGHVFSIRPNGTDVLFNGVDAKQVTRLARAGDRLLLATANPGRIQAMGTTLANPGTFLSPVRDAKVVARWGAIRWEATGSVSVATRSGNTDRPDESWSDWSPAYANANGSPVQSPAARYLQWRAVFSAQSAATAGASPALTSVSVGYLPANTRPVVTSITVHPAGAVFQKPFTDDGAIAGMDDAATQQRRAALGDTPPSAPAMGRRLFQKGLQTISWRAEDADTDRLSYSLAFRGEGESTWHEWRTGWLDAMIVWDTTAVPDGRYSIRISATDAASNTGDRLLVGERESAAFDVDNSGPAISVDAPRAGAARVTFTVRDAISSIDHVEYAVSGGAFVIATPIDGVADSPEERFEITLAAGVDTSRVVIRATDTMQNVTTVNLAKSRDGSRPTTAR